MARGRQIADAYIQVHGDLSKFNRDLRQAAAIGRRRGREAGTEFGEAWGRNAEAQTRRRWDSITRAMYTGKKVDWDRVFGEFDSRNLRMAQRDITRFMDQMRQSGKMTNDQFRVASRTIRDAVHNQRDYNREMRGGNILKRTATRLVNKMRSSWARMDNTVRLVLTLIAISAGSMATLLSGLSASLTGLISSLGMAIAAIIPLGAAIAGGAIGIGLLATAMSRIKEQTPGFAAALNGVAAAWERQVAAFADTRVGEAIRDMMNSLSELMNSVDFGTPFGEAFAEIADAFSAVLQSPGMRAFMTALQVSLPQAVSAFGRGFASVLGGLGSLMAAAAPHARAMGEAFAEWGERWSESMERMRTDGTLNEMLTTARASLSAVGGLLGSVGRAMGTLFMIGSESGNSMLQSLTGIVDRFTAWMKTDAGRESMLEWFRNGERIMAAMKPLLVGLAVGLENLVNEQTIAQFGNLMDSLGEFLPMLSEMLLVVSEFGILNVLAEALNLVGQAVAPLLPSLHEMTGVMGPMLQGALAALAPLLSSVFSLLQPLIEYFTEMARTVGPHLVDAIGRITEAFAPVIDIIRGVVDAVTDFLAPILSGVLIAIIDNVVGVIQGFSTFVTGIVDSIKALLEGDFTAAWEHLKTAVGGAIKAVWNILQLWIIGRIGSLIRGFGPLLSKWFTAAWRGLTNIVSKALRPVIDAVRGFIRNIINFFTGGGGGGGIGGAFASVWNGLLGIASRALGAVRDFIVNIFRSIWNYIRPVFDSWIAGFRAIWSNITGVFTGALNGIRTFIGNVLNGIWGFIQPIIQMWLAGFRLVWQSITGVFTTALNAVRNVITSVISSIWGFIQPIVQMWVTGFRLVWEGIQIVVSTAINAVRSVITTVINAVSGVISTVLGAIRSTFVTIWTAISTAVSTAINAVRTVVTSVINAVSGTISTVLTAIRNTFTTIWTAISGAVTTAINAVRSVITSVMNAIRTFIGDVLNGIRIVFTNIWTGIRSTVTSVVNAIRSVITSVMNAIRSVINSILNGIRSTFSSVWNSIRSTVSSVINGIRSTISSVMSGIRSVISGALNTIRSTFSTAWNAIKSTVTTAINSVRTTVSNGISNVVSVVRELPGKARSALSNIGSTLRSAGSNLIRGFIGGVRDMGGRMVESVMAPVRNAVNSVKNFLGIGSPSKLFRSYGGWTGEGLTLGMKDSLKGITSAATAMAAAVNDPMSPKTMYEKGKVAALGLADGLKSESRAVGRSASALSATLTTNVGGVSRRVSPVGGVAGASGVERSTIAGPTFAEGAVQVITPTENPELVAQKTVDRIIELTVS